MINKLNTPFYFALTMLFCFFLMLIILDKWTRGGHINQKNRCIFRCFDVFFSIFSASGHIFFKVDTGTILLIHPKIK